MRDKSICYIGAGMLLIGYAVLSLLGNVWQWTGSISFEIFRHGNMKFYFREIMNFWSWVSFGALILTGIVCIAKAFLDDVIPEIGLVGLFGILALVPLVSFFRQFFRMFDYHGFRYFINYVNLFSYLLGVVVFGGMAAIILLKSSFGSLFVLPAIAKVLQAGMCFIVPVFGLFQTRPYGFVLCMVLFLIDMVLVGALIALGKAVNEK